MGFETIRLDMSQGVAEVTLNRPDKLNSLNEAMFAELFEALKTVERDAGLRCLMLTGAGRGFCAGQDLSDRQRDPDGAPPDLGRTLERFYIPLVTRLRTLEKPVICAVNGVAAGAGANLALACDIVLAARSASFIQAFAKIGLVPDAGGTWTLPRLVGEARARALALLGDKLPADKAADWGLIWQCLDDDALMPAARAMAAGLAQGPTRGLGLIKRALNASPDNDFATQLALERDLQRIAGRTKDYAEGVGAFMEKRAPRFTGE